jgi:hypothetical protein
LVAALNWDRTTVPILEGPAIKNIAATLGQLSVLIAVSSYHLIPSFRVAPDYLSNKLPPRRRIRLLTLPRVA